MSDSSAGTPVTALDQALGRVPSGLFILTVRWRDQVTGMLTSWVQQAGFRPPMITVAVRRDRYVREWLEGSGRFVLNQVPAGHKTLIRHFARGYAPGESAFDGLPLGPEVEGGVVLAEALAYLACEVSAKLDGPDHCVFLAQVMAGALLRGEAEPMIHVRRSGHHY